LGAVASAAVGATGAPVRGMFAAQAAVLLVAAALAGIVRGPRPDPGLGAAPGAAGNGTRRPDPGLRVLAAAVAPATALVFQAFSGLALLLDDSAYRAMVLVNALVLVAAQPVVMALARRVRAGPLLATATGVLGAGMALHAAGAPLLVAVPLWTLAELVVIVVPSAVVAGLAPHGRTGTYVGAFQAVQGGVAALATFGGPLVAAAAPGAFAAAALALGAAGAAALLLTRRLLQAGLDQPVDCPCGAVLCRCGGSDATCVGPAPFLTHLGRAATTGGGRPDVASAGSPPS
ncbi:MAG TPA: hypothetical protein VD813_12040, partial [Pseudonocardia sp.]|nr:hypothetical protein [Pseudonocardia sp.]